MKKVLTVLTICLVSLMFVSCEKEVFTPTSEKEVFTPTIHSYKYEVTGTSNSYSVTLQNTNDNTQQFTSVENGWWYSWTGGADDRFLYLSAQNNNESGNVTVRLYKDNVIIAENTSFGGYSIATISGSYENY